MQYLISFLEGIISFISPCLLPMLPIYITYFAAGGEYARGRKTLSNAMGFVIGFTLVFVALGLFFGSIGGFLQQYEAIWNFFLGAVIVVFGLSFLGFVKPLFGTKGMKAANTAQLGFWKSVVFGMIFSFSWTPCVGAFLGSALAMASAQGSALEGTIMLLCFSLGLGIPFLLSALLIDKLKGAFNWIKRHYALINKVSGGFLILIGLLMMTGQLGKLLNLFS